MVRWVRAAALAALIMTAAQACGRRPSEPDGTAAAQAVLAAAWSGDADAFEAHLDRAAVRADLRQQLLGLAQANALDVQGGASDRALDRMISPSLLRLVQAGSDQPLAAAPTAVQTAALIKPLGKARACVHDASPEQKCVLTFAKEAGGWKLVSLPAAGALIAVAPEPKPEAKKAAF